VTCAPSASPNGDRSGFKIWLEARRRSRDNGFGASITTGRIVSNRVVRWIGHKVDECMVNDNVDRTEAMRRVRKRYEGLFDTFQIV
jgi:hypothetical protein